MPTKKKTNTKTKTNKRTRKRTPKPGQPVRGSKTGKPIMALLDLLGRRWALRVLWELHQYGPQTSRALRKACGDLSPTVLHDRTIELRDAKLITLTEETDGGYALTTLGEELVDRFLPLAEWARRWAKA